MDQTNATGKCEHGTGLYKLRGIAWLAEELLISQKELHVTS